MLPKKLILPVIVHHQDQVLIRVQADPDMAVIIGVAEQAHILTVKHLLRIMVPVEDQQYLAA